ncbi:MAG TPA: ATP-binding cassette domain-containing protein [Actinopolymorphaceae bacterium]|nr:ATP-binding cassette domain-containing protein [Actinopolymorphaceae bacterium]
MRMPTLQGYARFAGLAFRASPLLTLTAAGCTLLAAAAPLALLAAIGALIGQIPAVARSGLSSPAGGAAVAWTAAIGVLFTLQWGASALQTAAGSALGERIDLDLQRRLMSAVMRPVGIAHLEDPRSLDLINVGRDSFRSWMRPGRLAGYLSSLVAARFVLVGSCLILARFSWLLALALLAAALWAEDEGRKASSRHSEHHYGESELSRRTGYYYDLGVSPGPAKEVRVFGLASFLLERFTSTWAQATAGVFAKAGRRVLLSDAVLGAVGVLGFSWVCTDAIGGNLGLSTTAVYAQAIMVGLGSVAAASNARRSEMALATLRRYESGVEAAEAAAVGASTRPAQPTGLAAQPTGLAAQPTGLPPPAGRAPPAGPGPPAGLANPAPTTARTPATPAVLPQREIRFEGVRFGYPGTESDVLAGLDLVIPAGRSLAIVGANGAGKTTLVKLLSQLYQPTQGRIEVDGTSLTDLDPPSWRRRIAAVFQDYVRFELSARANVGFGFVDAQDDTVGIRAAADDAGASAAIDRLPHGWDTVLSSDYNGGVDLSGGEWQKVALARALFAVRHGASVLVLDEPAAHLDARAEAQLYDTFLALTKGVTTIVISHRFSTVRQASSIAVIRDGRVAEQGSHDELLAVGGLYAEMFRLQASRFEESTSPEEASVAEGSDGS